MDTTRLADVLRGLSSGIGAVPGAHSRRGALAAAGSALALLLVPDDGLTKKKRKRKKKKKTQKPCAGICPNGCCTAEFGACVGAAQQSAGQCGSGGEICRTTGCPQCTPSLPCPAGQCCRGNGTCGSCLVFVTSSVHTGNLGGLPGADAICQSRAATAGLPGTYFAWLSTSTTSPAMRFAQATVPFTLVDGTLVAANWTSLISGTLVDAIKLTEAGTVAGTFNVWTDTTASGNAGGATPATNHCDEWTKTGTGSLNGNTGNANLTTAQWTASSFTDCQQQLHLYCFQQR